jgi:hypothetical protein
MGQSKHQVARPMVEPLQPSRDLGITCRHGTVEGRGYGNPMMATRDRQGLAYKMSLGALAWRLARCPMCLTIPIS